VEEFALAVNAGQHETSPASHMAPADMTVIFATR